jgi:hypothetical protein
MRDIARQVVFRRRLAGLLDQARLSDASVRASNSERGN